MIRVKLGLIILMKLLERERALTINTLPAVLVELDRLFKLNILNASQALNTTRTVAPYLTSRGMIQHSYTYVHSGKPQNHIYSF